MIMSPSSQSIAVVTGGAGDIGRSIAAHLSTTHDLVFIIDIDKQFLSTALNSKELAGNKKVQPFTCDIAEETYVRSMGAIILSQGQVRTLVNNAGGTYVGSLDKMSSQRWRAEMSLNLDATYLCFKAFAESIKEARGSVINVTSVNALSVFGNPAYSAAKAALINFTKSIAVEYGKFGVRANAVAPGTVFTKAWEAKARAGNNVFDKIKEWYPLERVIQPEDVANAVTFLASDQAAAITGVCLPVDCGLLAGQPSVARAFAQSEDY